MPERERIPDSGGLGTLCAPPRAIPADGTTGVHDLSVCIVNWNCRDVLRDCLESLRHQPTALRFEIIVVDNGSVDGAPAMVADDFPEVRLIRNRSNAGFARANNQAARVAAGTCLFFLNNDTLVPPGALGQLVDFLERHPEAVMVGPGLRDAHGKRQTSHRRRPTPMTFLYRTWLCRLLGLGRRGYRHYRREPIQCGGPRDVDILMGAAIAMPRAAFERLGGWDESFTFGGEDMELCHRAGRLGRVVYCPEVTVTHLGSVSSKRHAGYAATHSAIGFARYFRKTGASRASLWCYKLAVTLDAPLRVLARTLQYAWRRARGQQVASERCLRDIRGTGAFLLHGLPAFWRT